MRAAGLRVALVPAGSLLARQSPLALAEIAVARNTVRPLTAVRGRMSMWGEGAGSSPRKDTSNTRRKRETAIPPRRTSAKGRERVTGEYDNGNSNRNRNRDDMGWGDATDLDAQPPASEEKISTTFDEFGRRLRRSSSEQTQSQNDDYRNQYYDQDKRRDRNQDQNQYRNKDGNRDRYGNRNRRESTERNNGWRGDNRMQTSQPEMKTNLKALEGAGFDHIYGLSPVLNALYTQRRDMSNPNELGDRDGLHMEDTLPTDDSETNFDPYKRKPAAAYEPYLFIQEETRERDDGRGRNRSSGKRTEDKSSVAREIQRLARDLGIPISRVDKGVLNTLSGNRPHQGYVLRCGKLEFEEMTRIPPPKDESMTNPSLWLVLDEVVDPQNFGALLRSAYFLGGGGNGKSKSPAGVISSIGEGQGPYGNSNVGILVCSKNSAPPSSVVSAASAGALELCTVYSTPNLPRTLQAAKENGWRILGAAALTPSNVSSNDNTDGNQIECVDLYDLPPAIVADSNDNGSESVPTILVLGSEGRGLRKLVAKACTSFVRIPGVGMDYASDNSSSSSEGDGEDYRFGRTGEGNDVAAGVDSLNVSVTGGILLWHLLHGRL